MLGVSFLADQKKCDAIVRPRNNEFVALRTQPRRATTAKSVTGVALVDFRNRQRVEKFLQVTEAGCAEKCWMLRWKPALAATRNFTAFSNA